MPRLERRSRRLAVVGVSAVLWLTAASSCGAMASLAGARPMPAAAMAAEPMPQMQDCMPCAGCHAAPAPAVNGVGGERRAPDEPAWPVHQPALRFAVLDIDGEGLRPDLMVGSSAGAMVGAYYASGRPVAQIEALAARLDLPTLIDIDPVKTLFGGFGLGVAKGQRLEGFLRESIGVPLQALPTRFLAVATDLNTGEAVLLNHGDTPRALRASSAVPGLYEPVRIGQRVLGDGQVVSPLPTGAARQLGARVVIGVDVVYPPQNAPLTSPLSVLFQTATISTYRHLLRERERADLMIVPDITPTNDLALADREWLIAAGEAAAQKSLPALRAAFDSGDCSCRPAIDLLTMLAMLLIGRHDPSAHLP